MALIDDYIKDIIKKAVLFLILESIILLFFNNRLSLVLGLLLGTVVSIISFITIYWNILIILGENSTRAKKIMIIGYIFRYMIYAIVIYFSLKSEYLNLITCTIGLLNIKLVLYLNNIFSFFDKRKEGKHGH